MTLKKTMWTVAKIAGVLAINAAVLAVLISDEEAKPQEAHADIADFMSAGVFASAKTGDIIEQSGLTPRPYEVNGNTVYVAVGKTAMSPMKVLDYYQTEFTAAGVNSKKWLENPQQKILGDPAKFKKHGADAQKMVRAMTDGEVVPYFVTENYVAMGGPVLKADNFKDIFDEWGKAALDDPNKSMKGWRFIDAQRTEGGTTRVTSIWADEDFDFNKMKNPNGARLGMNDAVPACPGCRLVLRSKSKTPEEPIALEQYFSQQDPETVAGYYTQTMTARGWELSDTSQVLEFTAQKVPDHPFNTQGKMLAFAKGNRQVTYSILGTDTGTSVTASESW